MTDDILIACRDLEEHDHILRHVAERATNHNVKLNLEKTRLRQSSVSYVGHIISKEGLQADPAKVAAVRDMPAPTNKTELKEISGICHLPGKISAQPEYRECSTEGTTQGRCGVLVDIESRNSFSVFEESMH